MAKKDVYELTNPQKSIWNMENFFENTTINNICTSGVIYEELDISMLKKALNNVVKKHDSFRIQIHLENDIPYQTITKFEPFDIEVIRIKDESEMEKIEKEAVNYKFNIIDSKLFRFQIVIFENKFGGVILNLNHIIADSWSLGLTIQEILKEYHAIKDNKILPEENNSYVEYINSEQEYKKSEKYKNDKKYWEETFKTIPEQATIPSNKKIKNNISSKAKREAFLVNADLVAKINEFCKREKLSVFNFLMAIYSIYISRVSNLDNFVIGTPILNRTNFKDKHTTGMFVNTVPIKIDIPKDELFTSFAHLLSSNMMSILKHQKYSYNSILEDLRAKNNNVPNLYNIIISYQITKAFDEQYGKYKSNWTFNNYCGNDFNIHISDINDTGELIVNYDYLTHKYNLEDVKNMHNRIMHMIHQVLDNSKIPTNDIEIVTEKEKNLILNEFNNTNVNYPKNKTIVDLFEEQVIKTPDNIAVVFNDEKLTYRELNEKANSLANYLLKSGIQPKTVIGLRLNKRLEMIIGILAIIKAGCCYLPINMQYPKDRVEFMLTDSSAKLLLGTSDSLSDIAFDIPKINIDLSQNTLYTNNTNNLNKKISPEDLIYIIYTSGSTGTPKGAMLCHRNLVRLFKNDKFQFDFGETDTWTMFHSVAFDFSVWEMYGALLFGGKLVLVPDDIAQDPELFLNLMRKENVTILNQTPTYFYKLLKVELEKNDNNLSIRYIIFGGEALKPNLIKGWKTKYPSTKLINMYGITETTVHVTFKELTNNDLESPSSNIGTPIPTLHVIIVDKNLGLLPFGVIGEMCVLGEGVFKGYLNREELNTKKLVYKPEYSNKVIYRSGDTAIMHEDGHLEYMGRIDTQVKIRGFRVELGEIEEKILQYSNIDTCIVTKKTDENSREMLCAYYINYGPLNISALRILLNEHLPSYMVPQYFIQIEKVPININGKTDYKALPLPNTAQTGVKMVKPRNKTDETLVDIYKNVLHIQNVSMTDSFYDLGGDSLTAINICETINQKFNIELKVKDILEKNIIIDLSNYISNLPKSNNNKIEIPKTTENEYYPLSSAQRRIYYTSKMIGDNNLVYNVPGAILINTILDKNKVQKCFNEIIKNQSSFRTSFTIESNDVKQKIHKNISLDIPTFNNNSSEIQQLVNDFPKPFDFENAPLLRVELHYIDNEKTLLLLESHHIIMDGTSLEILINDFCKVYNGENLEKLEIEYKDFAVWENKYIESESIKESEDYWINKFQNVDMQTLNLPYDYNIPSVRSYNGNTISNTISKSDFDKYVDFAKLLGVSPYMFFISAFFVLLYKYTGQEEIILGSPSTGRNTLQVKNIVGMFVNNITLISKINSNEKFTEFLNKLKTQISEDLIHQDYPYDLLVKKLNLPTDNSQNPLFDVMFAYQNSGHNKLSIDNENAELIKCNSKISKFNLSLEIDPDTRVVSLEYRTDLFKKETINRIFEHYINTLNYIVNNKDILIKDVSIISEDEKNKILYEFNDANLEYPINSNLPDLFSKIVKENYDNIAILTNDFYLSYMELDEKSNYLAMELYAQGIRKGDVIGVCLNKSIELVISIWAILKIGAIYMPMYINYPKSKLNYMLTNSNTKLLITTSQISNIIQFEGITKIINSAIEIKNSKVFKVGYNILPDDIAYIIYTSGSTGKPKGVQITSQNLINYIFAFTKYFDNDIDNKDNFLSSTNISFDVSIFELFLPILNGAKLVLYEEETISNIMTYCNSIVNNNITGLYIPPNILNEVFDILKSHDNIKIDKLLVGVEPITKSTLNKYFNLNPNIKIINGYGPTETTICCTALRYIKNQSNDGIVSIGSALYNNQIYILDKDKNIQPIGIAGEIYVTGHGVGAGYINKPLETKKNYQKNIFNNNSKLMYKTGDLAKWNHDGTINFIGREDSQVKISGHRIELNEINSVIIQYPNISKAYTTIYKKGTNTYILSYFTAENPIKKQDLKDFIKNKLPDYMIPQFITQLDNFPLTVNGKIDKTKLPINVFLSEKDYVAPRNNMEKQIIKIWQGLFLLDKISIDDDFFELGGNSLTAIKFQIESMNVGLNISYADIFSFPTPRKLSEKNINASKPTYQIDNNYDFNSINKLLSINNIQSLEKYEVKHITYKNILLVGATGFLGAHILDNYLSTQTGSIYCLIRKKSSLEPEERLKQTLNFYFGDKYNNEFGKRIFVINGDIIDFKFNLDTNSYVELSKKIDIVIHTAALVKHYGSYKQFKDVNVVGTQNIVNFCKQFDKKLYYISTLSISGGTLSDKEPKKTRFFNETDFYIKQDLTNVYTYTKFQAEKLIYEEIINGLSACILRIGNITNRYSDGKFQINASENAFANRIKSILNLGIIPQKLLVHHIEFTPVDICSDAIIKIVMSNPQFTTFHLYNNNFIELNSLLNILNSLNIHITPVSDNEFSNTIKCYLNNKDSKHEISGIITDLNKNNQLNLINNILPNSEFTQKYLNLIDFKWPEINFEYIKNYVSYLKIKYKENL